jgi:hypothetical protein
MADKTMLILRGNATDDANTYPDEQGKTRPWPEGGLHEKAAKAFATQLEYDPVVIDAPGSPQGQNSKQVTKALEAFHEDKQKKVGLYGFSGGGYNVRHFLEYLATHEPDSLGRIDRVVVIGAPNKLGGKDRYKPSVYKALAKEKLKGKDWKDPKWEVIFRENPDPSQMPKGVVLPKGADTHMFGPDVLLAGWPENYKPPAAAHHSSKRK